MIRYTLYCENGHGFDAWFSGSADFDKQAAAGLVSCAVCGSSVVQKAIMAPAVSGTKAQGTVATDDGPPDAGAADTDAPAPVAAAPSMPEPVREALRTLRKHVEANADYVGRDFPEEARKIHYGEADARGIYGEASRSETEELKDEGIEVHPLPVLPEDRN